MLRTIVIVWYYEIHQYLEAEEWPVNVSLFAWRAVACQQYMICFPCHKLLKGFHLLFIIFSFLAFEEYLAGRFYDSRGRTGQVYYAQPCESNNYEPVNC